MKKLLLATTVIGFSAISAQAADLAARPYAKAPYMEPVESWTGGYIGVNVGGGITHSPVSNDLRTAEGVLALGNTADLSSAGVIGGAQIGYNWQFAPTWVFGLEADIQGSSQEGSTAGLISIGPSTWSLESRLSYFGTARARLGFLATPSLLLYATGGFAWGETEISLANSNSVASNSGSFNHTDGGWTVGGGIEGKISRNWSAKAEYLYLDLGNRTHGIGFANTTSIHQGSVDFRDHIVRVGLNYHF